MVKQYMEDNILHFMLFCIYAVAEKYSKTSAYIFKVFEKYGVLSYISEFYDPLYTQGEYYIIDELEGYITDRGGKII